MPCYAKQGIFLGRQMNIEQELQARADKEKAKHLSQFYKTEKGEYAEGDKFLGINVPVIKNIVKQYYQATTFAEINNLLDSQWHEYRFAGVWCLVCQYEQGRKAEREEIVRLYLQKTERINNWDLVDCSAHKIIGAWAYDEKQEDIIKKLADSKNLWQERIAIVSSWYFIKKNSYELTLTLAQKFINHKHDLIHKAIGWMLREVGKKDKEVLEKFLEENGNRLPRTSLRYAIERFSKEEKQYYMQKKIGA